MVLRYKPGMKEAAILELFERFGNDKGVLLSLPGIGLTRRYPDPEYFPKSNEYAPGHSTEGYLFIKYEVV